jgi:bla regulator protein blaR1
MTHWVPFTLVSHLWQSTLFVGLIWLVTQALRRNRARARYWLWVAASMKFVVPVSVLVSLGENLKWSAPPAVIVPAVSFVMEDLLMPVAVAGPRLANSQWPEILPWLLLTVWSAGTALVLLSWWRHSVRIRSALREAIPVRLDPRFESDELEVFSSPMIQEVGVLGIHRPVLLLPEGLADRLTPGQFRALIAHERCHIRCYDNLIAALHLIIEALFWFHPFVWWIERRLVAERERACDESVLKAGNQPYDYATGILEVCQHTVESRLSSFSGVGGSNLRLRVEQIMRREIGRPISVGGLFAVCLLVFGVVGVPIAGGGIKAIGQSQQNRVIPAQLPPAAITFEVASVRPNNSGSIAMDTGQPFKGGRYTATNVALRNLVALAYGVPVAQVAGGPEWIGQATVDRRFIGGDRFDIAGTLPQGVSASQVPGMLRALLADRFKLVTHNETREVPMYALVLARNDGRLGPQLRKAALDCDSAVAAGVVIPAAKPGERGLCASEIGGEILGRGQRLSVLARNLSLFAGRSVVDKTGLTGGFDFDLRFPELITRPEDKGPAGGELTNGILPALQDQLGLKLDSIRGNLEFVVIDSVAHPTGN